MAASGSPFISSNLVVLTNSSVQLECVPDLYFPGYKVTWTFWNETLKSNSTSSNSSKYWFYEELRGDSKIIGQTLGQLFLLGIRNLEKGDSGLYSCHLPDRLLIDGDREQITNLTVTGLYYDARVEADQVKIS